MILDIILGKYGIIRAYVARVGLMLSAIGLVSIIISIKHGWQVAAESLAVQIGILINVSLFIAHISNIIISILNRDIEYNPIREKELEKLPFPFMLSTGLDPITDISYSARLEVGVTESELLRLIEGYKAMTLPAFEWKMIMDTPAVKASKKAHGICLNMYRKAKNNEQLKGLQNPPKNPLLSNANIKNEGTYVPHVPPITPPLPLK